MADAGQSLFHLVPSLARQARDHFKTECALARAEIAEHIGSLRVGLVMILLAIVLVTPAVTILLGGVVGALVRSGVTSDIAALLTGGATLIIGAGFLIGGIARVKNISFVPTRALEQLNRDFAAMDNWGEKP